MSSGMLVPPWAVKRTLVPAATHSSGISGAQDTLASTAWCELLKLLQICEQSLETSGLDLRFAFSACECLLRGLHQSLLAIRSAQRGNAMSFSAQSQNIVRKRRKAALFWGESSLLKYCPSDLECFVIRTYEMIRLELKREKSKLKREKIKLELKSARSAWPHRTWFYRLGLDGVRHTIREVRLNLCLRIADQSFNMFSDSGVHSAFTAWQNSDVGDNQPSWIEDFFLGSSKYREMDRLSYKICTQSARRYLPRRRSWRHFGHGSYDIETACSTFADRAKPVVHAFGEGFILFK